MAVDSQSVGQHLSFRQSRLQLLNQLPTRKMSQPDPSKLLPPLAPGPSSSHIYFGQPSTVVSRSKKNSTACLPCKAAKRKCSGNGKPPCEACKNAGTASGCHFDPTRDLRRKIAVKKTIQELTDYKSLLDTLVTTIRSSPEERISEIVDLIKSNGSIQELAEAVGSDATKFPDSQPIALGHHSNGEDLEQFESSLNRPSTSSRHQEPPRAALDPYARVTLESLCDIPLFRVPAKPWTKVTDDNELVSHLVSLYFTWDHPCAQFVDQGIFLRHMKRGDLSSEFCSPLLVNSLLSIASAYSDSPNVFDPENAVSWGQSFFEEAERLLKPQEGIATLTNIQALLMMCCVLSQQGKSSRAWWILRGGVQMAQDMGLFATPRVVNPSERSPEMQRAYAVTAWGVYSLNLQLSMKLNKVANLDQPASALNVGGDHDFDWIPYPRSNQTNYASNNASMPAHLPRIRKGLAELATMLARIQELFLNDGGNFQELKKGASDAYDRLQQELANWPDPSQIEGEPIPQLLILRIKYHQASMDLLEMLIEQDPEGTMSIELRQTRREQAVKMAQCLQAHRQSYGLKHVSSQVADAVQMALRVLVHLMDDTDDAKIAFTEICRFGIALSQKFQPTAEAMQAVQLLSQRGDVKLPTEALAVLDGTELKIWQE